jgi:hypothetical protein
MIYLLAKMLEALMALNLMSNIFAARNPESNNLSCQILETLLKTGFLHGVRTLHGVGSDNCLRFV